MEIQTKNKLFQAWTLADEKHLDHDATLAFMADYANTTIAQVADFIVHTTYEMRRRWFFDNMAFFEEHRNWFRQYRYL